MGSTTNRYIVALWVCIFLLFLADIIMDSRNKVDTVLKVFNKYHSKLKFTHDIKVNNFLSFLNTLVIRGMDSKILTNWYRKPTYLGKYINFFSSHPRQYKFNTTDNLVDQAILLLDERFHDSNIKIVINILINNCYSLAVIKRKIKEQLFTIKKNNISERKNER